MTPEARLDRLERIARLFVKAGLRQRRESRDQAAKIDHLINLQVKRLIEGTDKLVDLQLHTEERFVAQNERTDTFLKFQKDNEVRFARLAEYQGNTDRRLQALIEIVEEVCIGKSRPKK